MPSKKDQFEIELSTLETVDYALYDFLNDKLNNFSDTNTGRKKVPILWVTAERVFLSKDNKDLRDEDGTLKLPLITMERASVSKDINKKGAYFGNPGTHLDPARGGRITVSRKIVKDKTNNFAVAENIKKFDDVNRNPGRQAYYPSDNKKVIYETISMPIPVYLTMNYNVTVRTEYVQQMNHLTTPFATLGGHLNSFLIRRDGHQYETFLRSDFSYNNNVANMGDGERIYETTFNFEVLGYIIGESPNGDRPKIIKTQNAVEVKIPRERVILGDKPRYGKDKGFYRD